MRWRMGEKKGRIAGLREDQKEVDKKGEMEVRERYGERKVELRLENDLRWEERQYPRGDT